MENISPTDLKRYLNDTESQPLLLDVREPWEFKICHLLNSELVPMREIPTTINDFDKERTVVVICHHGIRSRAVAFYLEQRGFKKVLNLATGIDGWAREVEPSMAIY